MVDTRFSGIISCDLPHSVEDKRQASTIVEICSQTQSYTGDALYVMGLGEGGERKCQTKYNCKLLAFLKLHRGSCFVFNLNTISILECLRQSPAGYAFRHHINLPECYG